jgi:riboflavin synthase
VFTGIIEALGQVEEIKREGSGIEFALTCPFTQHLHPDQSLSHDGVCLTVTRIEAGRYYATAIEETLSRTNLGAWKPGTKVNLERAMPAGGRFEGHIVQGHVDAAAILSKVEDRQGSWLLEFELQNGLTTELIVEKGSITVNGTSLTCFNIGPNTFTVAIIPYTWQHTNLGLLQPGSPVNLEFDIVAKYLKKWQS